MEHIADFMELEKNAFWSPFEDMMAYNGQRFKIIKKCEPADDEFDVRYAIEFEDGTGAEAYLEELNEDYRYGRASYIGTLFTEDNQENLSQWERLTEFTGERWIARQERINGKIIGDKAIYAELAGYENLREQGRLLFLPENITAGNVHRLLGQLAHICRLPQNSGRRKTNKKIKGCM